MNLIIIKDKLKEGLQNIMRAASGGQNLPILKNVLISAKENKIELSSTNLEIAISVSVAGKIIGPGKTTVPAATFLELITNIPSERLNLELNNQTLLVKTDNYEAKIQTTPPDDFPIIPTIKSQEEYLEINGAILKDALAQVMVASQFSELRAELNSVALFYSFENLILVATDSARLAEKTIHSNQFTTTFKNEFSLLVPLKTAQEAARIIKPDEKVFIYKDENQILFKTESMELISRLIEETFPDYKKIIPTTFSFEAVLSNKDLVDALKLTGVLSSRTNEIKIRPKKDKAIEIFSGDESLGENNYVLAARTKGTLPEIGFNWRYLLDGLKSISGEEVFWGINENNRPAIFKSPSDGSYFYILMPLLQA